MLSVILILASSLALGQDREADTRGAADAAGDTAGTGGTAGTADGSVHDPLLYRQHTSALGQLDDLPVDSGQADPWQLDFGMAGMVDLDMLPRAIIATEQGLQETCGSCNRIEHWFFEDGQSFDPSAMFALVIPTEEQYDNEVFSEDHEIPNLFNNPYLRMEVTYVPDLPSPVITLNLNYQGPAIEYVTFDVWRGGQRRGMMQREIHTDEFDNVSYHDHWVFYQGYSPPTEDKPVFVIYGPNQYQTTSAFFQANANANYEWYAHISYTESTGGTTDFEPPVAEGQVPG